MKGIIGSRMTEKPQVNAEVLVKALTGLKAALYKDGVIEQIADLIGQGKDAAATVSDAIAMMANEMKSSIPEIDDATLFMFAVYGTAEIVRSLRDAGMIEDTKEVTEEAIEGAVMKYIESNPDSVDPSAMQAAEPTEDDIKRGQRLMTGVAA